MPNEPQPQEKKYWNPIPAAIVVGLLAIFAPLGFVLTHPANVPPHVDEQPASTVSTWEAPSDTGPFENDARFVEPTAAPWHAPTSAPAPGGGTKVWVNSKTGIYHMPGSRWYGSTQEGYYATEEEAKAQGNRASQRG
ncbi:hypothetical protein IAD21_00617 [Abditibacteriota bacterium]|nr:hypothetical protein IAD21_00617 [Abditibacteriota bacterium]